MEEVIAVGNADAAFTSPSESKNADIIAPGTSIISTSATNNAYEKRTGTSMAAAVVTGYLALLKNQYPEDTNEQLREKLLSQRMLRWSESIME